MSLFQCQHCGCCENTALACQGCTDGGNHSLECHAERAANIAGGVFVKAEKPQQAQEPEVAATVSVSRGAGWVNFRLSPSWKAVFGTSELITLQSHREAIAKVQDELEGLQEGYGQILAEGVKLRAAPGAVPPGLIDALKHQRQVDEDGTECVVSRQAVYEAIEILESLTTGAVLEGWQLVPIEPTDAMAVAAIQASLNNSAINGVDIYRAMRSAAPKPQGGA